MGRQYSFHDGELRIYDGSTTVFYYKVKFVQADPQIPSGRPRPEQRLILDRGRASSNMKYSKGPDDVIFEPLEISFTARVDENVNRQSLEQALKCGTVGGQALTSTKGTSTVEGVTLPAFDNDSNMKTVNIEILYTGATNNWGRKLEEVYFPPEQILFGPADSDGIPFSATGRVYGAISTISSFTTGTEVTE